MIWKAKNNKIKAADEVCMMSLSEDAYHQTILQLAEKATNEVSWNVTEHVLHSLWVTPVVANDEDENFMYGCQRCGYILHPGWRGTNLMVKSTRNKLTSSFSSSATTGSRKTARRRQQRKRKRQARAEDRRSADHGCRRRRTSASQPYNNKNENIVPLDTNKSSHTPTTDYQRLVLLKNDRPRNNCDRNHFVLTCGRCRDRVHLRGMPKSTTTTISPVTTATKNKKKMGTVATANNSVAAITTKAEESLTNNYEALLPSTTTTTDQSSLGSSRRRSLLEQKRDEKFGRKKIKKSGGSISSSKKSGNIMDFLSSLNDI